VVGLFARFDPLKDHQTFIRAAMQLISQFGDTIKFVLAGTGITTDNIELYSTIKEGNTIANFSLLGPRDDVPKLMNALDLLVSSSISESFPNVIGEAMATGIPCVVTDTGDSRVLLGEAGEVVRSGDAAALAAACARILRLSPTQRAELGAKGRERIRARYDISVIADNYVSLYSEILKSRK
jgi:glycosyltransferase involved in cell wall biosynthesis